MQKSTQPSARVSETGLTRNEAATSTAAVGRGTRGLTGRVRILSAAVAITAGLYTQSAFAQLNVPALSSRPGAAYTIYLNFAGFSFTGNWFASGRAPGVTPAYTTDATTTSYSASELTNIRQMWARIAENYVGLNVNVTTVDPAVAAGQAATDLQRQNYYDATPRLMHTVIGGSGSWYPGAGGVSYLGVAAPALGGNNGIKTNWMFSAQSPTNLRFVAGGAAHEIGHSLGLYHQSDYGENGVVNGNGNTLISEYSTNGFGSGGYAGDNSYAPTMGVTYATQRGLWRLGYANTGGLKAAQNDFSVLSGNPLLTLMDSGNAHTREAAAEVSVTATRSIVTTQARGFITPTTLADPNPLGVDNYTKDYFRFFSTGGTVNINLIFGSQNITPGTADQGMTFDGQIRFLDQSGNVVATTTRAANGTSSTFSGVLPAGNLTVEIVSVGGYDPAFDVTADYFTSGSYFLTGSNVYLRSTLASVNMTGANLTTQNLSSAVLTSATLTSVNFTSANFTGATLTNAAITGANFARSNLTLAQLTSTASFTLRNLSGVRFDALNLTSANLVSQNLTSAGFESAALAGAVFTDATVVGASFANTTSGGFTAAQLYSTASYKLFTLAGINLANNDLTGWNFTSRNLTGASFDNSTLAGAVLTGANVSGVNFTAATTRGLTFAQFSSTATYAARTLSGIGLGSNDLTGWNFADQNLTAANLSGSDLTSGVLISANLTSAQLSAANLTAANLTAATLPSAQLFNVNLTSANLSRTTANSANFTGATVTSTNFTGANLQSAVFAATVLTGTDISLADLRGATGVAFTASTVRRGTIQTSGALSTFAFNSGETLRIRSHPTLPATIVGTMTGSGDGTAALVVEPGGSIRLAPTALANASARTLDNVALSLAGSSVTPASFRVTPVTANAAGRTLAPLVTLMSSLSITSDGAPLGARAYFASLDLGTNDGIVRNGSAVDLTDMARAYLATGRGIGTTSALANTRIAVFSNTTGSPGVGYFTSYDGVPVTDTDVLLRFTYIGDTNLSGTVDAIDLSNLLEGLSLGLTGWRNGDLNYDGAVNSTDLGLLNVSLAATLAPLGTPTEFAAPDGTGSGGAAIPEPASVMMLLAAPLALARRRVRR